MEKIILIMAGGKGERFWPKSRERLPKQFLNMVNEEKTMIQLTVERVLSIIRKENIYVITNVNYKDLIYEQLPYIPTENIIFEPVGKNTAPAIGLGAIFANQKYEDALMAVLPSDHLIYPIDNFIQNLNKCFEIAEQEENIVTIGIKPGYPETGYGYIKCEDNKSIVSKVCKFTEKPNIEMARKYIREGNYLWNSGIFVWKISTILKNIEIFLPKIYEGLVKIKEQNFERDIIAKEFNEFHSESIDYGVLEKADSIYVIKSGFTWDDVGSWKALERIVKSDKNGNIVNGKNIAINTKNSIINGKDRLIATVGLDNIVVVDTEDVLLIADKNSLPEIKKVIEEIKSKGENQFL